MTTSATNKLSCERSWTAELFPFPAATTRALARLIERARFMSGFAVSAVRLGLPDTGLISYSEMLDQGRKRYVDSE